MFRPGTELLIDGGSDERLNDGMGTTTNGTGSDVLMLKAVQMRGGEEIFICMDLPFPALCSPHLKR